jgi:hypothetical protein
MENTGMTMIEWLALQSIRAKGYAITIWTPDELRGADPRHVEERQMEDGWDVISILATEPLPE